MPYSKGFNQGGWAYPDFPFGMRVTALTATATLTPAQAGIVAVTGGGAVTLTLPEPSTSKGVWYLIANLANQDLTVAPPTADTMITFNDAAADSVAFSTSSEKIGGLFFIFSDGTNWVANKIGGNTMTVAT